jgi:hypothetical protein
MEALRIGDPEEGRKYYLKQEKSYGHDWDRQTRHALDKLYRSEYRIYAIKVIEELKKILEDFIEKENRKWSCHNNSRSLFCYRNDGDIMIIDVYADEKKAIGDLEFLLQNQQARFMAALGNHWSIDKREWYTELK